MQFLKSLEVRFRQLRNHTIAPLIYRGDKVECPVCERTFSKFLPAGSGHRYRENAVCPYCRSRERDRLNWFFLQSQPSLFNFVDMAFLHVAPEPCFSKKIAARVGDGYITADLMRKDVMIKLDVMDIQYPDETFDAIYCSHVLQDVPDDNKALSEFYRTLKPGGWAVVNVPLFADVTQNSKVARNVRSHGDKRPDEHVREYGKDYESRLKKHHFTVDVFEPTQLVTSEDKRTRFVIDGPRVGYVHFIRKPAN